MQFVIYHLSLILIRFCINLFPITTTTTQCFNVQPSNETKKNR